VRWFLLLGLFVAAVLATAGGAGIEAERTVPCSEAIATTRFPYVGSNKPHDQYRLVLASVSVPPAHASQGAFPSGMTAWPFFRKSGMVIPATGVAVTITVPPAWRQRLAISWGNAQSRVFSSIRLAGCSGSDAKRGRAFAGGFFLRSRSACVPLVFRVGSRRETVWFGIARRCR
jgi:hypothetical protein